MSEIQKLWWLIVVLLVLQGVADVLFISELRNINPMSANQREAKAFVAEQLAPFEKRAADLALQKKAAELQEEYYKLHPEKRPAAPPTASPTP